ncbi:NADH dehydrogenase [ubiquinone] 1 beta subcomplex subunit 3-like [Danio aesculapii]|uniref:NADH dehydrogenase [ubiquinone] 1 beta subcomplex subunit 3-like n=1 Tax=Danio aesculapii TaxID=1142201 RepID=UPI0024BFE947|nr:NADH dehydrogenase [ubiquinone] 1 beta subcomplex subunit 3-like [Danio aesculapii]
MGGDHGHAHGKTPLPDYRQWKWEGTPLEVVQKKLAGKGLRDPWARNEAWRYKSTFSIPISLKDVFLRGFKYGFAAFVVSLAVEYTFFPPEKSKH